MSVPIADPAPDDTLQALEQPAGGGLAVGEWPAAAAGFAASARSPATLAAYRSDWARFTRWCARHNASPLPAEPATVAACLADAATTPSLRGRAGEWAYSPATLARWVATINKAHDLAGQRPPGRDQMVRDTLAGIRRQRAQPPARKTPVLVADLERMVNAVPLGPWPAPPAGIRNRAILVMGWVGAFRRSELAGLTVGDVVPHGDDGLHVRLRIAKNDPEARGRTYALPYARRPALCAPCAWRRWIGVLAAWEAADGGPGGRAGVMRYARGMAPVDQHCCRDSNADPTAGLDPAAPLLRPVRANGTLADGPLSGHAVNAMIKHAAQAAGLDPERIGGHSLRAGFVTSAFWAGADPHAIMRQTGHADPKTLEVYAPETSPLVGNAVTLLDL